jgi:hypothetical protein
MSEMHEYDESHADTCQKCKDLKNKYPDEDAQIEDYHKITPITNKKRKGVDASLSDLIQGKNVRMKNDGNFYASQLDGLELDYGSEDDSSAKNSKSSKSGGKRKRKSKRKSKSNKIRRSNKRRSNKRRNKTMKRRKY